MTTKTAQLKIIDHAFHALPQIFHHFDTIAEKLFKMNLDAERQHRKMRGGSTIQGFSAAAAARLFTVRHLAEALKTPDRFSVTDILSIRLECLFAQAYAAENRAAILSAWEAAGVDLEAVLAVDYSELMGV
jgi:hypothetical protein